ncbi:MAG: CRISPR-associated protein Cas7, partial [bacterium]
MDSILNALNVNRLGVTFNYQIEGKELKQKEVTQQCDPTYYDQLLAGWMSISSKKTEKEDDSEKKEAGLKRRSPLSISAMTPVHPLLAGLNHESKMTFDRT